MNVERKVQGQVQKKRWSAQGKENREYVPSFLLVASGTNSSGAAHRRSLHEGRNEEDRQKEKMVLDDIDGSGTIHSPIHERTNSNACLHP